MPIKKLFVSAGIFNYIKISSDSMPNILYRCQTCILLVKTHAKLLTSQIQAQWGRKIED